MVNLFPFLLWTVINAFMVALLFNNNLFYPGKNNKTSIVWMNAGSKTTL